MSTEQNPNISFCKFCGKVLQAKNAKKQFCNDNCRISFKRKEARLNKEVEEWEKELDVIFKKPEIKEARKKIFDQLSEFGQVRYAVISEKAFDAPPNYKIIVDEFGQWDSSNPFKSAETAQKSHEIKNDQQQAKVVDMQNSAEKNELSDHERKSMEERIKQLEIELKNPPPNPQIGKKAWIKLRENEINKLQSLLNQ